MNSITKSIREQKHGLLARRAAAEGIVLLENNGVLPLAKGSAIALYSGGARYTIKGGTGSGSVNNRYNVNIDEGLRNAGFVITTDDWLDTFDATYEEARRSWMDHIYEISEKDNFFSLYNAYSSNRLEMPKGPAFTVTEAEVAIYVISRVSGESVDRRPVKGDYYLSDTEEKDLAELSALYPKLVVILNTGGVIDLSFLDRIPVSALVLMSQAGMEGGNALADVLSGEVNPSGRLTDSWAYRYEDYPCQDTFSHRNGNLIQEKYREGIYVGYRWFDSFGIRPRYPFGYGLSYTSFSVTGAGLALKGQDVEADFEVLNTGSCPGRQVLQLYGACPQPQRDKEWKRLLAFGKTPLLSPGEKYRMTLQFSLRDLASYHTARHCYYMDGGNYYLLAGCSALDYFPAAVLTLKEKVITETVSNICPLLDALTELHPTEERRRAWAKELEELTGPQIPVIAIDDAVKEMESAQERADGELPANERIEELIHTLSPLEKARIVCGQPSQGSREVIGAAAVHVPGAAGETANFLEDYGVGVMVLADGPAGLRLQKHYQLNPADGSLYRMSAYEGLQNRFFGTEFLHEDGIDHYQYCSAIPVGTLLAQTFDTALLEEVGRMIGEEMAEYGVDLWLAPGMNIHRNPLCGRNFEYYSEDPLVSGYMAAAITRGVQSNPKRGTTIKHFACNNQEDNRMGVSSIVSERALREIYLKGFEIAVKRAQPKAIMTSYNRLNSVHTANSYDLCTVAARQEWGFQGMIMTDWVTTNQDHGSSAVKCIQAGNDLIMPGNESDIREIADALEAKKDLALDMEDLDACARRVLRCIME